MGILKAIFTSKALYTSTALIALNKKRDKISPVPSRTYIKTNLLSASCSDFDSVGNLNSTGWNFNSNLLHPIHLLECVLGLINKVWSKGESNPGKRR
jgi:hypothetical protein